MIIGVSGKIRSGKDTVGKIITNLISISINPDEIQAYKGIAMGSLPSHPIYCNGWQIKKFAYAVKQVCSILTGIPVEDFEKEEVKNSNLPNEWIRYGYADGFKHIYEDGVKTTIMINKQCNKERYELELKTNWQTAYKTHLTYRELLQIIGTDLIRNKLHENAWVNALMAEYKISDIGRAKLKRKGFEEHIFSALMRGEYYLNWIITDVRFPNEAKAIKDRNGIIIRVNRSLAFAPANGKGVKAHVDACSHPSETYLDNYTFDYTIDNNGTIEELIEKVKEILIKEKII